MMQSNWKNIYFQHFYGHFKSHLHRAPDRSAIFFTNLAGQTVKKSPSAEGPGFKSLQAQQKCHRSIVTTKNYSMSVVEPRRMSRRPVKNQREQILY